MLKYNRSNSKEKWTMMMYMRDFNLMTTYAYALRAANDLTEENIESILIQMESDGIYRPRSGGSIFTGEFKCIQIAWYMFGYYDKSRAKGTKKRFVFSPLGNLLLDNIKDKEKVSKIFTTMLFACAFRQPFSHMSEKFNIYPFRLIFQLLTDPRLNKVLYHDEAFYLVMYLKTVDEVVYEQLVLDILDLRSKNPYKKLEKFKKNERVVGLACHEWRYVTGLLESAGIVSVLNDHDDRVIGKLFYGNVNPDTGKPSAVRSYTEDYIVLNDNLLEYVNTLLESYPCTDKPYDQAALSTQFSNDLVTEMYSFYPEELLTELGMSDENDQAISMMMDIAKTANYYAEEDVRGGHNFETALTNLFNLFDDVEARHLGGSGETDIECIYLPVHKKFDVEAKATKNKLSQINPRRIKAHRQRVESKYTVVVTPRYSVGVLYDIDSAQNTVIVKSASLTNFVCQNLLKYGRDISYEALDRIIEENLGQDITDEINDYVYEVFGHGASDMKVK